jgi:hypothetical protein
VLGDMLNLDRAFRAMQQTPYGGFTRFLELTLSCLRHT